jgi:uncharacterized protein YdeI (YjbR/CyaY-like superfamily)
MAANREEIFFATRSELRNWLAKNFNKTEGIWAVHYKKTSGLGDLSWEAIVEECLCFGWIDSLPGKVDETKTKIYISPRKANSGWSRRNKDLLIELQKSGLIKQPGLDVIDRAKANGSWERFDMSEALEISHELQLVFDKDQKFFSKWKALSEAKQRQALQLIYDAKTQATMQNRIQDLRQSLS